VLDLVPFFALADGLAAAGARRLALHDHMASTHVVRTPQYARRAVPLGLLAAFIVAAGIGLDVWAQSEGGDGTYTRAEFLADCARAQPEANCECLYDRAIDASGGDGIDDLEDDTEVRDTLFDGLAVLC
jgi:hypothetical protein